MSETVTFYAWNENTPSSEMIHISGGKREKDTTGNIMAAAQKDAHFVRGIYHTSDPEIIEGLRLLIRKGKNDMSEDIEDFNRAVLSPARQASRAVAKLAGMEEREKESRAEISRLRQQLEDKARENKILKARKEAAKSAA